MTLKEAHDLCKKHGLKLETMGGKNSPGWRVAGGWIGDADMTTKKADPTVMILDAVEFQIRLEARERERKQSV